MQLTRQNLIGNWIKNKEEYEVVLAHTNKLLMECSVEEQKNLVDLLGEWRYYLGINKDFDSKELVIIGKFIVNNFGDFSINEIKLAMEMSINFKLDVENNPYNQFSVFYVASILNAYKDYRAKIMNKVIHEYNKEVRRKEKEAMATPENLAIQMRELIKSEYEQFKNDGEVYDTFSAIFNYLRKQKRLDLSKEMGDKALQNAREKASREISKNNLYTLYRNKESRESLIKRYARCYCVMVYFQNNKLEDILKLINEKDFYDTNG